MSEKDSNAPQYEICVACGEMTDVPWDMPIDCRRDFVHGCGQLCKKCAGKLERESKPETTVIDSDEMKRLMDALQKQKENSE